MLGMPELARRELGPTFVRTCRLGRENIVAPELAPSTRGEVAASAQMGAPSVRNVKKPTKTRTEPFQKDRVYTVVLGSGTQ